MTKTEVALLLSLIAAYDQRTIGNADVEAWHAVAQHARWDNDKVRQAVVAHYARETRRIMPADITQNIRGRGPRPSYGG